MANNVTLSAGTADGATFKSDDIGGVQYACTKLIIGAEDTDDGYISSANPLPVTGTITGITNTVTVDLGANNDVTLATLPDTAAGDLAAMVVDLAAIEVLLGTIDADTGAIATSTSSIDGKITACNTGAVVISSGTVAATMANTVDDNNSSTTPLTGGATFTGTATDVLGYRNVGVSVFADQDSATDGLKIQFSTDGTNWDQEEDFTVSASVGENHTIPVMGSYVRVTYTNGGSVQSAFRLETILITDDVTGTVAPLSTTVGPGNQAMLARAVISAENPSNAYVNVGATNGGSLKISLEEADGLAGQAVMASSVPVVIASNQSAVPASQSGTWNITNVSGTVSLPTGAATAANQATGNSSLSNIDTNTSLAAYKRASGLAASGTVAMVAAVAAKKIRIHALALMATSATATNVYVANADNNIFGDATNPIALAVDADGDNIAGFVLPWNPGGWAETDTANEALNVVLSAAQDVIYAITYSEVD